MATVETVRWLGIVTILSTALCAAGVMICEDLPFESRATEVLVPTALVGVVDLCLLLYVAFVA